MNNIEFDRKLREISDNYSEPVGTDLWPEIEKGLNRKRVMIWVRRCSAVAVAASLVAGLFILSPEKILKGGHADASLLAYSPTYEIDTPDNFTLPRLGTLRKIEKQERPDEVVVVNKSEEKGEVAQMTVEEGVENKEEGRNEVRQDKVNATPVNEPFMWEDFEDEEVVKKSRREFRLGVSSNILALNSSSMSSGSPMYIAGIDMTQSQEIKPVKEPKFALPLTFGLQVQFPFSEKWGVGTGVNYTYLKSNFQALVDNSTQAVVDQSLHYIGIPVSLFFTPIDNGAFRCYIAGGGMLEKGLQVVTQMKDLSGEITSRKGGIDGLQWSVNLGVGVEYSFTKVVALYLDPSLVYFFDNGQPFSVRTSQPMQLKFELGLRFNIK